MVWLRIHTFTIIYVREKIYKRVIKHEVEGADKARPFGSVILSKVSGVIT